MNLFLKTLVKATIILFGKKVHDGEYTKSSVYSNGECKVVEYESTINGSCKFGLVAQKAEASIKVDGVSIASIEARYFGERYNLEMITNQTLKELTKSAVALTDHQDITHVIN